jgi:serine/threonine-protein kinase
MVGQTISHYKVLEKIGEGGMGEVYRATDTKLNRDVALKILPEQFASDSQRMGRFQREAEVLASLDHPNIGQIYGIEEAGQTKALVLQLIEGPTLAERIAQGPIPVEDALKIALQMAEGLEAAHEKGVIHRDFKPANIKINPEGQVKILDFGLAKALEGEAPPDTNLSQSPTLTAAATQAGVILGTAAYMSPEQAKGKQTDTRADTWGFGAVVYEMLTGKRAFEGEDVSDTLAAVLRAEVGWSRLPSDTPTSLRRLLERCLDRDLRRRLGDIREARIAIEDYLAHPLGDSEIEAVAYPPLGWQRLLPWAGMALFAVTTLLASLWMGNVDSTSPLRKVNLAEERASFPLISPDGKSIAFLKDESIWTRRLDQGESRRLEGTEGADTAGRYYFWSHDSRSLAFVRDQKLWRVSATAAGAQIVCDFFSGAIGFWGGSWGADETIVLSIGTTGLSRVAVGGGDPEVFLEREQGDEQFRDPHILPEGRGILFAQRGSDEILLFDGQKRRVLLEREGAVLSRPLYSTSGHLIFSRTESNEGIWAVPFSLSELNVTGDDFKITAEVGVPSVSEDGTLVYLPGTSTRRLRQLLWVNRSGEVLEKVSQAQPIMGYPALSPDETQVAVYAIEQGSSGHIWIHDTRRGTKRRLTSSENASSNRRPFWGTEGKRVGFTGEASQAIFIKAADGSGQEEILVEGGEDAMFSSNGKYLIYAGQSESGDGDLWYLEMEGDGTPQLFLRTPADEHTPRLSPDGGYLAYESSQGGNLEIYLRRFPSGEGVWLVSTSGGQQPLWSKDGKELYYSQGNDLMAVEVNTTASEPLRGNPQKLFSARAADLLIGRLHYDVSSDGRILMIQNVQSEVGEGGPPQITIVENWFAEFKDNP